MPRTSNRRWKGCPMCKPNKYAQQGDGERQGLSLQRQFGRTSRINRHDLPDDETVRSAPARKDKRLNCGGKVGRPHQPENVFSPPFPSTHCGPSTWRRGGWACWHREICARCGKVLRYWLGADCPDYVTAHASPTASDTTRTPR